MVLLFKYLNNNCFYIIVNTLLIKRKRNSMHTIIDYLNVHKPYKNSLI